MVIYNKYAAKEWNELKRFNRQQMADVYRRIRKDNPAYARLLYAREKAVVKELTDELLYGSEGDGSFLKGLLE